MASHTFVRKGTIKVVIFPSRFMVSKGSLNGFFLKVITFIFTTYFLLEKKKTFMRKSKKTFK